MQEAGVVAGAAVLRRVSAGKWSVWSDTARMLVGHGHYSGTAAVLSMFGPHNAVRAIWAKLVGRADSVAFSDGSVHCWDGLDSLALDQGESYFRVTAPLGHQLTHVVLLHPLVTHHVSPFSDKFVQAGPRPQVAYFPRLTKFCPVPLRPVWRDALWRLGQAKDLIVELPGFGMPAYMVVATDRWADVVREGIAEGVLR